MLSLIWALGFIILVSAFPLDASTNSPQQLNVGTGRTFPLLVNQKKSRRELYFRQDMVLVEDAIRQKLPLSTEKMADNTEGTALVNQDGHDISYYIQVKIGSKGDKSTVNPFNLVVDTGSFYTWVYSQNCTSAECSAHNRFNVADSTSAQVTNDQFSIAYTSGNVAGTVAIDTMSFSGFTSPQHFGLANDIDSSFSNFPIDGIMGLPPMDKSPDTFPGIISTLYKQSLISTRVFGINLGRGADSQDQGSFTIGGLDDSKYTGNISYTPALNNSQFWELPVANTFIDGSKVDFGGSRTALIDTGTTLLIMSPADALKVHSFMAGSQTDGSNFVIPCNTTISLSFEFSGRQWPVSPSDYVGASYNEESGLCISNIQGIQFDNNRWIFGDVFLKNVYSVYDMESLQVGFANKSISSTDVTPEGTYQYLPNNSTSSSPSSQGTNQGSSSKGSTASPSGSAASQSSSSASSSPSHATSGAASACSSRGAILAMVAVVVGLVCIH